MSKWRKFRLEVVTPMFLAGFANRTKYDKDREAEPWEKQTAAHLQKEGIRVPSLKGVLRFWYRAWRTAGLFHEFGRESYFRELNEREMRLFGSTEGSAKVVIRPGVSDVRVWPTEYREFREGDRTKLGLGYLGYGPVDAKKGNVRPCIAPGSGCDFHARFLERDPELLRRDEEEFYLTLWFLSYFGAMGSRSRHGFGSVSVSFGDGWNDVAPAEECPPTPPSGIRQLESMMFESGPFRAEETDRFRFGSLDPQEFLQEVPCFTCENLDRQPFDPFFLQEFPNWERALERTGRIFHSYRSYKGENRKYKGDHDAMRNFLTGGSLNAPPERIAFGLPHNYYFSSLSKNKSASIKARHGREDIERRASPLFLKVIRTENAKTPLVANIFALVSQFLPQGAQILVESKSLACPNNDSIYSNTLLEFLNCIREHDGQK